MSTAMLAPDVKRQTIVRLLALALGTFAIGTDGFVIAGVLVDIADDLTVPIAAAGALVTAFSIAYAISAPVVSTLLARFNDRTLLVGGLVGLAVTNAAAALAPGFAPLVVARVLAALAAAAYAPTAYATAAQLADEHWRGRALSVVAGGLTLATVIGVPLGTLVGSHAGWRASFWLVTVLSVLALVAVVATIPRLPQRPRVPLHQRLSVLRNPLMLQILALTMLAMLTSYAAFTYIDMLVTAALGPSAPIGVGLILIAYGCGAVAGNALTGAASDRLGPQRVLIFGLLVLATALLELGILTATRPSWVAPALVATAAYLGFGTWMITPPQQQRLLHAAGAHAPIAISLNGSALHAGIALGALLGGLVLQVLSPPAVCTAAAVVALLSIGLVARRGPAGAGAPPGTPEGPAAVSSEA